MADDEDTVPGIADAGTPVKTPVVKKPRGPRRQKSATEVTTPDLAKSGIIPRTRRKRDKDTGELEPVSAAGKTAAKAAPQTTGRSGKNAAAKPPEAVAAINEMGRSSPIGRGE